MSNRTVTAMSQRPARAQGFTLIELMVAVAIIAILSAVAIPSYTQYVVRSKITEATGGLAEARLRMEQYYQDNRKYNSEETTCGADMPDTGRFEYSCETDESGQTFTITATSQSGEGLGDDDGAYVYTLTQANARATTTYKGAEQTGKTCWLLKGTEC